MTGKIKFLHIFRSEKSMARQDKRAVNNIRRVIDRIDELSQKEIPEDIQKGDIDEALKDVTEIISILTGQENNLEKIESDCAILDFEALKRSGRIEERLEKIENELGTKDLNDQINQLRSLSNELQGLINKARLEARDAIRDRERVVKYRAYLGYNQLGRNMRNLEVEIKSLAGKEKQIEARIMSEKEITLLKKDVEEAIKVIRKEAQDIYEVEHDDIIFTFYVLNKLYMVTDILNRLKQEGFPAEKQHILETKFAEAKQILEQAANEAYRMERYMGKRVHRLAA
jgi:hypothetical protein